MVKNKNKIFIKRIIVCLIPVFIIVLGLIVILNIDKIVLQPCFTYKISGLYCPGCGATRAVRAFAKGDFLLSFGDSPLMWFGGALGVFLYIQLLFKVFGKPFTCFVNTYPFIYACGGLIVVYTIARNVFPILAPI